MVELLWLIPALPLVGFVVLLLVGKRIGEPLAGWLGTAMVGLSFLVALVVFVGLCEPARAHLRARRCSPGSRPATSRSTSGSCSIRCR